MEKSLYAAPTGLTDSEPNEVEFELDMGDPVVEIDVVEPVPFDANLAEYMDESALRSLATDLISDFDKDQTDRKEWIKTYVEGLKLLGLKYEDRTEPWDGACGVFHPMLTESVVRFQSEAITETFPAQGPVKTLIIGNETPDKEEAAARVRDDMNYQLTDVMTEYRPEHEKMLWSLALAGSAFKKVYYDPNKGRQTSVYVPAEDIVAPYGASNLESAERVTHVMRKTENELRKLQVAGFYRDIDLGEPSKEMDDIEKQKAEEQGMSGIQDERYRVLEMQVDLNLEGYEDVDADGEETGIALPYIVTLEKGTARVLSIRRNWYQDDTLRLKRDHLVHYQYIPGFGFYGYGLIHLIGGYAKSATMLVRQLIDAGTLSNLPGGLKTKGLRIKGDDTPIAPGEFRDVDVPSGAIRDNIMALPYKEPSQVLFALFQNIVEEGRAFASSGDMNISDMSAQAPVGTTLALLERTLKVMGAVQARMHFSMRKEFKLLKNIIADYAPEEYTYDPQDAPRTARKSDYETTEVIPVSDPNATTMAQKVVQYQAVIQLSQTAPQIYDMPVLHRQMIEVLGVKNAAKLVPTVEDAIPVDPVQENQNFLTAKTNRAFMIQNHDAHIACHMAFMQDPVVMQMLQQNPQAPAIVQSIMAHVNEHMGFKYRKQVETMLGQPLPGEEMNKQITPEVADQIAVMAAQATQQIVQQNTQQAQQQQAQQQMQDPVIQMQMQELQLKQQELQLKQQKQAMDGAEKADRLRIEESRIEAQKEIAAMQVGAQAAAARDKLQQQQELEGVRLGADIAKSKAQQAQQARQAGLNHLMQLRQHRSQQNRPPSQPGKSGDK